VQDDIAAGEPAGFHDGIAAVRIRDLPLMSGWIVTACETKIRIPEVLEGAKPATPARNAVP
jgi:hypothetical protein